MSSPAMSETTMGAYYDRSALEEFADHVLGDFPGMMVSIERVGALYREMSDQTVLELTRHVHETLGSRELRDFAEASEDDQITREYVLAALFLRRRILGISLMENAFVGVGPLEETEC